MQLSFHPARFFGGNHAGQYPTVCLVFRRDICLIPAYRSCRCLPAPSIVRVLTPQTGVTLPAHHAPPSLRRRGFHAKRPTLPAEGASQVECGWIGCGMQLDYNEKQISRHINKIHKMESQQVTCQWEKPGGHTCGKRVVPSNLRKHILDIHTVLMVEWCEWCGGGQRRDRMNRHKKICKQRKEMLPDYSSPQPSRCP